MDENSLPASSWDASILFLVAVKETRTPNREMNKKWEKFAAVAAVILVLLGIQRALGTKEGFQQEPPTKCVPGTELRLEVGMCCPLGIVDVANCWLTPKCPEPSFWDPQRLACYTKDPSRDPYVVGYPQCNTMNAAGKSFVFDLDQRRCCDPSVTMGPKVCDNNFICPRSSWDPKRGYCVGRDPRLTAAGQEAALADTGPGVKPEEKTDVTLAWIFGGFGAAVLTAVWLRGRQAT